MSSRGKSYKEKIKLGWGSDIDRGDNLGKVGRKSFKKYSDIEVNTWMKWEWAICISGGKELHAKETVNKSRMGACS